MKKTKHALSAELQAYLSRDLRQVIREVLANYSVTPSKQLVEDIYDLVMVEATDVQYRAMDSKIDQIVQNICGR